MSKLTSSILLATCLVAAPSLAIRPEKKCAKDLSEQPVEETLQVMGSGRTPISSGHLRDDAILISDMARRLGLFTPPQDIISVNPGDMLGVVSASGYPSPHWIDGFELQTGIARASRILEVVFDGTSRHVQFHRDTNTRVEGQAVLGHVVGHHDIFGNSLFYRGRGHDILPVSKEMARFMSQVKLDFPDDLKHFYHALHSFPQDSFSGSWDSPSLFNPHTEGRLASNNPRKGRQKLETRPSRSVLQSMVHNLPGYEPPWKVKLAEYFEHRIRGYPAFGMTNFIHEGWSMFWEQLLAVMVRFPDGNNLIEFATAARLSMGRSVHNHYWLGFEAVYNEWTHFTQRAEILPLSLFEKAKAFVTHMHRLLDECPTNEAFLRRTLDEKWVENQKYYLFRDVVQEVDGTDDSWSHKICVSRDPKRILEFIIRKVAYRPAKVPDLAIENLGEDRDGIVHLRHTPHHHIPLKRASMAQALYQMAKVYGRPVRLETIFSHQWAYTGYPRAWDRTAFDYLKAMNWSLPMAVTVTPEGHVEVTVESKDGKLPPDLEVLQQMMKSQFQKRVDRFRVNLDLSHIEVPPEVQDRLWARHPTIVKKLQAQISGGERMTSQILQLGHHVPMAGEAAIELWTEVRTRLTRILQLVAQGKWNAGITQNGMMTIRGILPEVPTLALDLRAFNRRRNLKWPTPVETTVPAAHRSFLDSMVYPPPKIRTFSWWSGDQLQSPPTPQHLSLDFVPDEDLSLATGVPGQLNPVPGDRWGWSTPGNEGGINDTGDDGEGEGDGEGDGDGEDDGEDSDSDSWGSETGGGGIIRIPMEEWLALLDEMVELRNLRPTRESDGSEVVRKEDRTVRNPHGEMLIPETAEEVFQLGLALSRRPPYNRRLMTRNEIMRLGLKFMTDDEIVVSHSSDKPKPIHQGVIAWIADTSGSMMGEPVKIMKTTIANERAILKRVYPNLKEIFIVYDVVPRRVATEEEFFELVMGGGTDGLPALELLQKIYRGGEFPPGQYCRFARHFSDGGDGSDIEPFLPTFLQEIDYMGYSHVDPNEVGFEFEFMELSQRYLELSKRFPDKLGFTVLNRTFKSVLDNVRTLYGVRR